MAILSSQEIFFTAFEPKVKNRFIMYIDGFPSYMIKSISGLGFDQGEIKLNHINIYRKIKGKMSWNDVTVTLFDPITPSGAQAVMEWTRLHHESVTGRDGYSDFYRKDVTVNQLGPVGDKVSEWVLKGAFPSGDANFGTMDWSNTGDFVPISLQLSYNYAVLQY
jgi:hypothetical protein